MNLFLVTSPFQYICAVEAKHKYQTKQNILLVVNQEFEPGITQQKRLIKESEWDYVIYIGRRHRSRVIPLSIKKIKRILAGNKLSHFFHAEHRSWRTKLILRNLPIDKEVQIDDGTTTINEYEESIRPHQIYSRPRLLQDLIIRLHGCHAIGSMEQSENLELFTIFDIENPEHPLIKNEFEVLKARYNVSNLYDPDAPIGFIGQGAIGHKRQKTVESYVKEILHFQEKYQKEILYFPHRTESGKVRERLKSIIPQLTYHHSELPLELELIDRKIKLSGLVGILSTAQYTSLLLYPGMPIFNLKNTVNNTDYTLTDQSYKREQRVAKLYKQSGIIDIVLE